MRYNRRRRYSAEFKRRAVEQSLASPETLAEVAARLGLNAGMLSRWRRELTRNCKDRPAPVANEGPAKSTRELERENARLKKRLERAELENEILKKATEYFTENPK
jgi:transposase